MEEGGGEKGKASDKTQRSKKGEEIYKGAILNMLDARDKYRQMALLQLRVATTARCNDMCGNIRLLQVDGKRMCKRSW